MIAWIASAHFFSHLYLLVLPPIFPLLKADLGVSYAALGLAIAIPNLATALLQSGIGFLVDRWGARWILIGGQSLMALSILLIGLFPDYGLLLALMLLAGVGNAVYHPADYAILASRVGRERTGRAFSIHTFGGFAGFAMAPVLIVSLTGWFGWETALMILGGLGMIHALMMIGARSSLSTPKSAVTSSRTEGSSNAAWTLLSSRPVLAALCLFALIATVQTGFLSFTVVVLDTAKGLSLAEANLVLSLFLWTSAFGVLLGGWIADGTTRHDGVAVICFLATAGAAVTITLVAGPTLWLACLLAIAGLATGAVSPSRDMLVNAITPEGASGKVFGFVTTGFNIGGLLAPPLFGALVDAGRPNWVFGAVAAIAILTAATVWQASARRRNALSVDAHGSELKPE